MSTNAALDLEHECVGAVGCESDDEGQPHDIDEPEPDLMPEPEAQSQEESLRQSQHNQEVEIFRGLWWKCIEAMRIEAVEAHWVSKSVAKLKFTGLLQSATNYLVARMNAQNVQGKLNVDKNQTMAQMQLMGFQIKAYHQGTSNPEIFMGQCRVCIEILDAERVRIKHNIIMHNKRQKEVQAAKEVRRNPDGVSKQWCEVDCCSVTGRLSPGELAELAEAIRQLSRVHLDSWCKTLGLGMEIHSQQSILPIMEQACAVLPVVAVKRKHSKRDVWLHDYHNLMPQFMLDVVCVPDQQDNNNPFDDDGADATNQLTKEQRDDSLRERVQGEIEMWEAHIAEEFAEQLPHPCNRERAPTTSHPTSIKKYPHLVEHIRKLLGNCGATMAHSRRRDSSVNTIGIGSDELADTLFQQWGESISGSTVLRMYNTVRSDDDRSAEDGGRYNYVPVQSNRNRNTQYCNTHVRAPFLNSRNRDAMELHAEIAIKKGAHKVAWFAADGKSKTVLGIDATTHLHGSCKGHTLADDDHNYYDHQIVLAASLKMDNFGVAICRHPGDEHVADKYGRPHLQRPVPKDMCCFLRSVRDMKGEPGCQTYRHVRDIEETWLSLPAAERPEYLFISLDNGDGSDPTEEKFAFYLTKFMSRHLEIKMIDAVTWASGHSVRNYFIELQWGKFNMAHIGQRFGQSFLRENGEGRRTPTAGEYAPFFERCAAEMKELYEKAVTISYDVITNESGGEERVAHKPSVVYVPALSEGVKMQIAFDTKLVCNSSQKVVDALDNKEMKEFLAEWNTRTVQTLNGLIIFSEDCPRDELFGPSRVPLLPEWWSDPSTGERHHASYLQKREKYQNAVQLEAMAAPIQGIEKCVQCLSVIGCIRTFRFNAQLDRHNRLIHGGHKRNRAATRIRRRKRGRPRIRVTRSVQPCNLQRNTEGAAAERSLVADGGGGDADAEGEGCNRNLTEDSEHDEVLPTCVGGLSAGEASGNCSEANASNGSDGDGGGFEELPIEMVVGKRQVDDEDVAASDAGHCTFIWWADLENNALPKDQCTWEPNEELLHVLDVERLQNSRVRMRIGGAWSIGTVVQHVSDTKFKVKFSSRNQVVHDMALPPSSNCTEWYVSDMAEHKRG